MGDFERLGAPSVNIEAASFAPLRTVQSIMLTIEKTCTDSSNDSPATPPTLVDLATPFRVLNTVDGAIIVIDLYASAHDIRFMTHNERAQLNARC